jgi:hypothetical protein
MRGHRLRRQGASGIGRGDRRGRQHAFHWLDAGWIGGTTRTVGGILGWTAGSLISNTTFIPMDLFIAAYPGSGANRDLRLYNTSPNAGHIVVDVVGYFIENQATPLD